MAIDTNKNSYTLGFAIAMVVVVGSLLAFLASYLKDRISENRRLEKQQNILYAMGVNENDGPNAVKFVATDKVAEEFERYIKKQYVIKGNKITEAKEAYLIDIKKEETKAKNGKIRSLPLFVGEKEGKNFYIIPMRGKGLWDAIWGFMALDEDFKVSGVFFDHAAETPGLGSNIKERFFMDDFIGEEIFSKGRFEGIKVAKGNADPSNEDKTDNEVDAIAGATITGDGVSEMIKRNLKLYLPHFKTLKSKL